MTDIRSASEQVEYLLRHATGILGEAEQAALRTVLAEHQEMRLVLWRLADDEPCDIDHNGNCQAHHVSAPPCATAEARRLVGEWQPAGEPATVAPTSGKTGD